MGIFSVQFGFILRSRAAGYESKLNNQQKTYPKKSFNTDVDIQDATLRRIEVIGEAVKNISQRLKKDYPKIEWKKIAGTRDVLIHAYFKVDLDLVWDIVKEDLPNFKKQLKDILKKQSATQTK